MIPKHEGIGYVLSLYKYCFSLYSNHFQCTSGNMSLHGIANKCLQQPWPDLREITHVSTEKIMMERAKDQSRLRILD